MVIIFNYSKRFLRKILRCRLVHISIMRSVIVILHIFIIIIIIFVCYPWSYTGAKWKLTRKIRASVVILRFITISNSLFYKYIVYFKVTIIVVYHIPSLNTHYNILYAYVMVTALSRSAHPPCFFVWKKNKKIL